MRPVRSRLQQEGWDVDRGIPWEECPDGAIVRSDSSRRIFIKTRIGCIELTSGQLVGTAQAGDGKLYVHRLEQPFKLLPLDY